jgi:hypothetical protein
MGIFYFLKYGFISGTAEPILDIFSLEYSVDQQVSIKTHKSLIVKLRYSHKSISYVNRFLYEIGLLAKMTRNIIPIFTKLQRTLLLIIMDNPTKIQDPELSLSTLYCVRKIVAIEKHTEMAAII